MIGNDEALALGRGQLDVGSSGVVPLRQRVAEGGLVVFGNFEELCPKPALEGGELVRVVPQNAEFAVPGKAAVVDVGRQHQRVAIIGDHQLGMDVDHPRPEGGAAVAHELALGIGHRRLLRQREQPDPCPEPVAQMTQRPGLQIFAVLVRRVGTLAAEGDFLGGLGQQDDDLEPR